MLLALLLCLSIVASLASYAIYVYRGSLNGWILTFTALAILDAVLLSYVSRYWECLEVLAIAYPCGVSLSLAIALIKVKLALRRAVEFMEIRGVRVYLCSSRGVAFTFFPFKKVFLSKYLTYLLSSSELEAIALHEYGHQVDRYKFANLAIATAATLSIAASTTYTLAYSNPKSLLVTFLTIYASIVAIKSSSWVFEHVADSYAALSGKGFELCTALIKVHACSRLGKLCVDSVVTQLSSPLLIQYLSNQCSYAKLMAMLLLPKPSLHPPIECRLALINQVMSGKSGFTRNYLRYR